MTEQEELLYAEFGFGVENWVGNVLMCAQAHRMCCGRPDDDEQLYVINRNTVASAHTFASMLDEWSVYDLTLQELDMEWTPEETRVLELARTLYDVDRNPMYITSDWHADVRAVGRDFWVACRALSLRPFVEAWEVRSPEVAVPMLCWCKEMAQAYRGTLQQARMQYVKLLP